MSVSIRRRALASAVALILSSSSMAATLFLEDFQTRIDPNTQLPVRRCTGDGGPGTYPFPETWLLRNVDNRTPATNVAYVNEAWEVREDFLSDMANCAAFSTSWYSPAGAANDWMWTPLIGPLPATGASLSWRGQAYDPAYPDGYEVRVMTASTAPTGGTGVIGNQLSNSTVVFSTGAEMAAWTNHVVDLTAYQGQSIYVGFRNSSNDKFILVIDDIKVVGASTDLAAASASGYAVDYSRVPDGVSVNANYKVVASNLGTTPFTNIVGSAQPTLNAVAQGSPVSSASVPSLAAAASTPLSFAPPTTLTASGIWGVTYAVAANETGADNDPTNNTLQSVGTTIGGIEWARHEGTPSGTLGIGAGNGGELGTTFTLIQTASFEGIRFGMAGVTDPAPPDPPTSWPGKSVVAVLRGTDGTGKPDALIATTTAITSSYIGGVYDVKFVGGAQTLAPGTYFVGVVEPIASSDAMPLQVSLQRYVAGTNWTIWPTIDGGTWKNLETFGTSFQRVPNVSLLSEVSLFKDDFELHVDPPAPGRPAARAAGATSATTRTTTSALAAPRR